MEKETIMDYQKKNKVLWIVIGVLAALLIAAVVMLAIVMGGNQSAQLPADPEMVPEASVDPIVEQEAEEPQPTETEVPVIPETPSVEVETPYGTLYYPGEWEELLHVEQREGDVYTVAFFSKLDEQTNVELFHILFGVDEGIGAVKTADGQMVNVTAQSLDIAMDESWSTSQKNIVFTMQEGLNFVLEHMDIAPATSEPFQIPEDDTPMEIDTNWAVLKYPARWEQYLEVMALEDGMSFYAKIGEHEAEHMFAVYFEGDKGIEAATVKTKDGGSVTLRLELAQPELDDSWGDDERRILLAMQEDMNYLLMNLPV